MQLCSVFYVIGGDISWIIGVVIGNILSPMAKPHQGAMETNTIGKSQQAVVFMWHFRYIIMALFD